jgi:hypothetical protein
VINILSEKSVNFVFRRDVILTAKMKLHVPPKRRRPPTEIQLSNPDNKMKTIMSEKQQKMQRRKFVLAGVDNLIC